MLPLCLSPDLKDFKVISHFLVFGESPMAKKKKKTKRKLAHPKLPMQRHLNLRHEGTHFDLRAVFDELNERYFRRRLRGVQGCLGPTTKASPERTFHFWHDSRGRSRHSDQSCAGSAIRAALVFALRALSRDAAFGCAR